jgi:hypothetical protein
VEKRRRQHCTEDARWEGRFNPINPFLAARFVAARIGADGRPRPVFPGYRASWVVPQADGGEEYTDGPIDVADGASLPPGTAGEIRIFPLRPEVWIAVAIGDRISMYEGDRVVGEATVTEVCLRTNGAG